VGELVGSLIVEIIGDVNVRDSMIYSGVTLY